MPDLNKKYLDLDGLKYYNNKLKNHTDETYATGIMIIPCNHNGMAGNEYKVYLVNANGEQIGLEQQIDVNFDTVETARLDFDTKCLIFTRVSGETFPCDISELIDDYISRISEESERAQLAEEELENNNPFEWGQGEYSIQQKGTRCEATGEGAIATGIDTHAGALGSHTEGGWTATSDINQANYSHVEGLNNGTNNVAEHGEGKFGWSYYKADAPDSMKSIHYVGIGTTDDKAHRKDAEVIMLNGDKYLIGVGGYTGQEFDEEIESVKSVQEVINDTIENLTNEVDRASAAEKTIDDNLNSEISRSKEEDETLRNELSSEIERSKNKDNELDAAINQERQNREAAINALDYTSIGTNGKYIQKVNEVDGKISEVVSSFDTAIVDGTATHNTAPTSLAVKYYTDANIANEASIRQTKDNELSERINNLSARGRFLSTWDATTGTPGDYPPDTPLGENYDYKSGDYYIIINSYEGEYQNNLRPSGSYITHNSDDTWDIPSEPEYNEVKANDYYVYSNYSWLLISNTQKTVSFGQIAGFPRDNSELYNELSQIDQNIELEQQERESKDSELQTQISDTNSTVSTLSYNLDFIKDYDIPSIYDNINTVQNELSTEIQNRQDTDQSLEESISLVQSDLFNEQYQREQKDNELESSIGSKSTVYVSEVGSATNRGKYITVDDQEYRLADVEAGWYESENNKNFLQNIYIDGQEYTWREGIKEISDETVYIFGLQPGIYRLIYSKPRVVSSKITIDYGYHSGDFTFEINSFAYLFINNYYSSSGNKWYKWSVLSEQHELHFGNTSEYNQTHRVLKMPSSNLEDLGTLLAAPSTSATNQIIKATDTYGHTQWTSVKTINNESILGSGNIKTTTIEVDVDNGILKIL